MAYQIKIETTGQAFSASPGETIIEAARRQGVSLPYGCRTGRCGSCLGSLVQGSVAYPDGKPDVLGIAGEDNAVFCQAVPTSDLTIRIRVAAQTDAPAVKTVPCRAQHLQRLSHDVMHVELKIPSSEPFEFFAGQYIEFLLRDGRRRAFSIANAPHNNEFIELHIRHVEGGSFTGHVFDEMRDREMLRLEGPLGSFFLREDSDRPVILMGGGTGFAPLKGMLEHAFHTGIERPLHLFWGVHARRDLYLDELPRQWQQAHENFRYTPVLSHPADEDHWQGATGLVTDAVISAYPELGAHDIYMSGPPVMIEEATPLFVAHGADMQQMFSDAFEFASDVLDKLRTRQEAGS